MGSDAMADETTDLSVEPIKEPDFEFLDPAKLQLVRDEAGWLRLLIKDDRCYLDVKTVRTFPLSDPDRYIAFLNSKDKVIGVVVDPEELEPTSKQIASEELRRRYFVPRITRIQSMKEEFGSVYFEVETNMGERRFVVRGIRDALIHLSDGRLLILDVDGNRYMIEKHHELDPKSRRLLDRVI
jgi:hypothetical protein